MNLKKKATIILLLANPNDETANGIFLKDRNWHHLYIINNDEIKENDWMFYKPRNMVQMASKTLAHNIKLLKELDEEINNFKVISSTDSFLNLPQPSPQFIQKYCEEYNRDNQIVDIMVTYDYNLPDTDNDYGKPQIDKNNCITITKIKDSWNREEVSKAIHDCMILANSQEIERLQAFIDEWIKDNL